MQKVQIFSVGTPKPGTAKAKRRYRVKWRVDGRGKTRSLKTRAEANRLKSRLEAAVREGDVFDVATGEPVSWSKSELTWFDWACEWLELKWPQWAGSTRKSCVEYLVAFTPFLTREGAPSAPAGMRSWLWSTGFNPPVDADDDDPYLVWLVRWSVPLVDIGPALLEDALHHGTLRLDGSPVMPTVARRRRNGLKSVLKVAVIRGLLNANPMDRVVWRIPTHETQVDVTVLPSVADIDELLDHVNSLSGGRRYAAFFACCGFAGMRPSEAAGLRRCDLTLPDDGWGMAILRGAITSPGARSKPGSSITISIRQVRLISASPVFFMGRRQLPGTVSTILELSEIAASKIWWRTRRSCKR